MLPMNQGTSPLIGGVPGNPRVTAMAEGGFHPPVRPYLARKASRGNGEALTTADDCGLTGVQWHGFRRCKSVFLILDRFRPQAPVSIAAVAFDDFRRWQGVMGLPFLLPSLLERFKGAPAGMLQRRGHGVWRCHIGDRRFCRFFRSGLAALEQVLEHDAGIFAKTTGYAKAVLGHSVLSWSQRAG